ncbi:MAG: DUF2490 domain-containing protein [Bacteroidia bacterium]|nr:DUF2490 domain-containing protein [Bacteroidia bacterium]MDW8346813.1 DUF2490 domain-containing protein [Bacteroidia bacterium]
MIRTKVLYLYLSAVLACLIVKAQSSGPRLNNLAWYSFVSIISRKQWYWQAEVHERHLLEPIVQHQFIARYALYRQLGQDWAACIGISYLAHNTFRNNILQGVFPHAEVEHVEKIKNINITHNYRFELRFFDDSNVLNPPVQKYFYYHNVRIRYRLQLGFPLFRISQSQSIRLRVFDELHLNVWSKLPNNGFHHNRFYLGLNIPTAKNITTGIGFMHWLQQSGNQVFTGRKIYWIILTHRIAK